MQGDIHDALIEFVDRLALGEEGADFLSQLPEDVLQKVITKFNPRGTKDGNVLGRLMGFAKSLGAPNTGNRGGHGHGREAPVAVSETPRDFQSLDDFIQTYNLNDEAAEFLEKLQPEVLDNVVSSFDPGHSKDGNYFARLLACVRLIWSQWLKLEKHTTSIIKGFPEEVQMVTIVDFNPEGSRDGRLDERVRRFAEGILARYQVGGKKLIFEPEFHGMGSSRSSELVQFIKRSGLQSEQAESVLMGIPQEVLEVCMQDFDPAGTKDGDVLGRLLGFIKSVAITRYRLDAASKHIMDHCSKDVLARLFADGYNLKAGAHLLGAATRALKSEYEDPGPRLRKGEDPGRMWASFAMLDHATATQCQNFVSTLPQGLQEVIATEFKPSNSKDGNVFGRLVAFSKGVWQRGLGLVPADTAFMKDIPMDVQAIIISEFDPGQSKDGNISARLQGFARSVVGSHGKGLGGGGGNWRRDWQGGGHREEPRQQAPPRGSLAKAVHRVERARSEQGHHTSDFVPGDSSEEIAAQEFLDRCGLADSPEAVEMLWEFDEHTRSVVIREFDHRGTKDGNVLGRLEGFARSVAGGRGRKRPLGGVADGRSTRPRY